MAAIGKHPAPADAFDRPSGPAPAAVGDPIDVDVPPTDGIEPVLRHLAAG